MSRRRRIIKYPSSPVSFLPAVQGNLGILMLDVVLFHGAFLTMLTTCISFLFGHLVPVYPYLFLHILHYVTDSVRDLVLDNSSQRNKALDLASTRVLEAGDRMKYQQLLLYSF